MISFDITATDLTFPCLVKDGKWVFGASFFQPYAHGALEAYGLSDSTSYLFIVREKNAYNFDESKAFFKEVSQDELLEEKEQILSWPLHYVCIHIDIQKKVKITTGTWGVSPIYVTTSKNKLIGHWHVKHLYPYIDFEKLNHYQLANFLVNSDRILSRETIFSQIHRLTERATMIWNGNQVNIQYPSAIEPPSIVKELKKDADVLGVFRAILKASMERYIHSSEQHLFCDLSGGLDSSILSSIATSISKQGITTYGMLILGEAREAQIRRRRILVEKLGTRDVTIDTKDHLPLSENNFRIINNVVVPWGGFLHQPNFALYKIDKEVYKDRVLFNGYGGDELFIPYIEERVREQNDLSTHDLKQPNTPFFTKKLLNINLEYVDQAPMPIALYTSYEAAANSSHIYMENDIWPVSPFCTPELIRFVRALPHSWRKDRRLQRDFLTQIGCSREITHPKLIEVFNSVLIEGLRNFVPRAKKLLSQSFLADLGLIDPKVFLETLRQYLNAPFKSPIHVLDFYTVILLELSFISIVDKRPLMV